MPNEHIVHVIKKVRIFIIPSDHNSGGALDRKHYANIYDGGTHLKTRYGETYNGALNQAVKWVFDNFSVPESITLRTELPRQVEEYFDEQTRLRQRFVEEE